MSELKALYQELILDHNKNPRNFRKIEDADRTVEGYNPLCGDHYTIYLKMSGDTVQDISFTGSGCAISKASASVMSSLVKGKSRGEAERLFSMFHKLVTGEMSGQDHLDELGKLAAFSGVSEYPARVKCASLAWHTMKSALETTVVTVSTE
jgi:nitrogen fixation NifU-like protein